ncbi:MAG TPA: hypothetical protein VLR47_02350, partial [Rhodospirillales bacterium]|nr:hypothetical protein [Rhodospirillales bacterium]
IVEEIAAALEDRSALVDLDRARIVGGMPEEDVDPSGIDRDHGPPPVPSRKWLEFEGGVISGLFKQAGPALSRRGRSRHDDG